MNTPLIIGLLLSAVPIATGQILADFTGGNGTSSADQYRGIAGSGWTTAWVTQINSGVTVTGAVVSPGEVHPALNGDRNYLSVETKRLETAPAAARGALARGFGDYGSVALANPHTISFYYRLDSEMATVEQVSFTGSRISTTGLVNGFSTWSISATSGGNWLLVDGSYTASTFVDTGLAFNAEQIYHFSITVNPVDNQYVVVIENVTTEDSYSSQMLDFATKNISGNHLIFSTVAASGKSAISSLGTIAVIPEAGSMALLGGGALLLVGGTLLRRTGVCK